MVFYFHFCCLAQLYVCLPVRRPNFDLKSSRM